MCVSTITSGRIEILNWVSGFMIVPFCILVPK